MRLVRFFKDKTGQSQQPLPGPELSAERRFDRGSNLFDRCHAVHGLQQAPFGVIGDQRRGLLGIDTQVLAQHFLVVVRTGPTRFLGAIDNTLYQFVSLGLDLDDGIEGNALVGQHLVQGFRLGNGARETIEDEARLAIFGVEPLGDDAVDDGVGHEVAAIDNGLGLKAERRLGRNGGAQDIAGGELGNAIGLHQNLRLCTLARPRRSQQDQPHRRVPPPRRDFFNSPSYCWATRWLWICVIVSSVTVTMISSDVPPMNWLTANWLNMTSGISATTVR